VVEHLGTALVPPEETEVLLLLQARSLTSTVEKTEPKLLPKLLPRRYITWRMWGAAVAFYGS
jgi:hypothetical protein